VSLNDGAKEVDNSEEFLSCACIAYIQFFHYNFTVTVNALRMRKDLRQEAMEYVVPLLYFY